MNARPALLQVVPVRNLMPPRLPLSLRPHFVRRVAGNGEPVMHSQGYVTRGGAVRAARKAAAAEGLWVHVHDDSATPRVIRTYNPKPVQR